MVKSHLKAKPAQQKESGKAPAPKKETQAKAQKQAESKLKKFTDAQKKKDGASKKTFGWSKI